MQVFKTPDVVSQRPWRQNCSSRRPFYRGRETDDSGFSDANIDAKTRSAGALCSVNEKDAGADWDGQTLAFMPGLLAYFGHCDRSLTIGHIPPFPANEVHASIGSWMQ